MASHIETNYLMNSMRKNSLLSKSKQCKTLITMNRVPGLVRNSFTILTGLLVMGWVSTAFAQVRPDAGALQQQLQREVDRNKPSVAPEELIKKPVKPSRPKTGAQAIDVASFKVIGLTLITQEQAQEVLKPFNQRKLTLDQIKEAGDALTGLYAQQGRMAQAVIPPQDVVDGVILIKIIEGKVGEVIIELNKELPSRLKSEVIQKFITHSNASGNLIDLPALERTLAILNETPGNEVSSELIQGDKEETTNILINAKDTSMFSGRIELSNYGAANTGPEQVSANLSLNNPGGIGDQATLDAIGSMGSVFGQFKYGLPVGYDGWRVAAGVSALNYNSLSSFSSTNSQGTAQTYGIYSTYALERTARSNKSISVNFENKNYDNQTNGVPSSSYQINNLSFGINGNNFVNQMSVNWGVTATLGSLSISNSSQAANDANGASTQGSFAKISFNGSMTQPLPFEKTNLVTTIYGQLANKNLNSAEQFYLGGPYAVRAYPVAQGGGSQGAIVSFELNHTLIPDLQIGAFFDAGLVQQYINTYDNWQAQTNAGNTYPLYATGLLAKYQYEKIQISGLLAWRLGDNPLYTQSGMQLNTDNQYRAVQAWIKGSFFF